jgi:hypothetical protein
VRTALGTAAVTAVRWNDPWRAFFWHLRQANRPPEPALTACLRKLLTVPAAILRDGKPLETGSTRTTVAQPFARAAGWTTPSRR